MRSCKTACAILPISLVFLCWNFANADNAQPPALSTATPAEVGMDAARLERIDEAIQEGIDHGLLPGAVILVVRDGKVVYRNAYGLRSKQPAEAPLTAST